MRARVFDTLTAARAAFALGPVSFRCNVCGGTHRSGSGVPGKCLRELEARLAEETVEARSVFHGALRRLPLMLQEASPYLPPFWLDPAQARAWEEGARELGDVALLQRHVEWPTAFAEPCALALCAESLDRLLSDWRRDMQLSVRRRLAAFAWRHRARYRRAVKTLLELSLPEQFPEFEGVSADCADCAKDCAELRCRYASGAVASVHAARVLWPVVTALRDRGLLPRMDIFWEEPAGPFFRRCYRIWYHLVTVDVRDGVFRAVLRSYAQGRVRRGVRPVPRIRYLVVRWMPRALPEVVGATFPRHKKDLDRALAECLPVRLPRAVLPDMSDG